MTLIGILSAIAISKFADTSVYRQALFINQLQSLLGRAQNMAMSQQREPLGVINQSAIEFSLVKESDDKWRVSIENESYSQSHSLSTALDVVVDTQVLLLGQHLTISFNSQGDVVTQSFPPSADPSLSTVLQVGENALCIAPTGFSYEGECI